MNWKKAEFCEHEANDPSVAESCEHVAEKLKKAGLGDCDAGDELSDEMREYWVEVERLAIAILEGYAKTEADVV